MNTRKAIEFLEKLKLCLHGKEFLDMEEIIELLKLNYENEGD